MEDRTGRVLVNRIDKESRVRISNETATNQILHNMAMEIRILKQELHNLGGLTMVINSLSNRLIEVENKLNSQGE